MNDQATSLDRLHDIALPPDVPWWPPAPGWLLALALLAVAFAWGCWRVWKKWSANAYRRAALRELATAEDAIAIAELLRRTALACAPRRLVVERTGDAWVDWLSRQCSAPLSERVRDQLAAGIYAPPDQSAAIQDLREFAARWISEHQPFTEDASA